MRRVSVLMNNKAFVPGPRHMLGSRSVIPFPVKFEASRVYAAQRDGVTAGISYEIFVLSPEYRPQRYGP